MARANSASKNGARGGIRTRTPVKAKDFKSSVSTVPPPGRVGWKYTDELELSPNGWQAHLPVRVDREAVRHPGEVVDRSLNAIVFDG